MSEAELASIAAGGAIAVADGGSDACNDQQPAPGSGGGEGPASEFGRAIICCLALDRYPPYVWGGGDTNGPPTGGGFDCSV